MASEDLERLLRWESAGGTWELVGSRSDGIELDLLTCARDEVMERLRSDEPDLRAYVRKAEPTST
ncbi:hypothetical protein [Nocardioides pelophilus]|uniref:hypothetical protein n=1 Tax=Nocardioides pelophilus TaxID=2172019 RepID=UPI00160122B4|nr:hypothetical protein [Nocardioides pelophilus]